MASGETRQRRTSENESFFREVNERVEEIAQRVGINQRIDFVCECADPGCAKTIEMGREEYETLRAVPKRFAVAPGHDDARVERIVKRTDRYVIVEKVSTASRVATELDPRRSSA